MTLSNKEINDMIPRAVRFEPYFCGACPNLHLLFFDKTDFPICQATISASQADQLAAKIRANDPNFRTPTGGRADT